LYTSSVKTCAFSHTFKFLKLCIFDSACSPSLRAES
jgi:hypothetical protein